MKRLSFRQKLLLTYIACTLVLVFVVFASASYYINRLQKSNVKDAVALATEQAQKMSEAAQEMLASRQKDDLADPDVRAGLRAVTRINLTLNKNILWAAVVSPDGDRLIQEFGDNPKNSQIQRDETATDISNLDLPNGNKLEVTVTAKPADAKDISFPIPMDGNRTGHIELRVLESDVYKQIEQSSQRITRALIFGCLLMLLFLLGIYYILWRMFFRQLELQENNAKLDRMAYVGTLASGLAHEIRNPLSSMNVNLEVIREELDVIGGDAADHTRELSGRVQREVLHLNKTLTSFLDFALPRKEGFSQFPLRGLVDELLDAHAEEMKSHGIQVEIDAPPASATVIEADRRLLHQAIRNILLNAIQVLATSVKKVIRIRIELLPKDNIRLSVSDTGPGISQENMAQIFEVFFSTRKGGSGFGLAIARKILEEHHGRLWAENNPESLGATFILELPILASQEQEERHVNSGWSRLWTANLRMKDEQN